MITATSMAVAEIPMVISPLTCASMRVIGIAGHMAATKVTTELKKKTCPRVSGQGDTPKPHEG